MKIIALYAVNTQGVFGVKLGTNKYDMPWKIPEDLANFKKLTIGQCIIMGKNTYMSLPVNVRPLKDRITIVVTQDTDFCIEDKIFRAKSLDQAIGMADKIGTNFAFIIGGAQLLTEAINNCKCDGIRLSYIYEEYKENGEKIYAPVITNKYVLTSSAIDDSNKFEHKYYILNNSPSADRTYLDLVNKILKQGHLRKNRTDTDTMSLFSHTMSYDLTCNKIPLLTTKRVPFRSVAEELLFFLKGHTDTNELTSSIWKGNTSREFLDKRGLDHYKAGLMGPMYGYQFRHFNAKYDSDTGLPKEGSRGVDQLANVLNLLKNDPFSRRIMMTAYNPYQSHKCVLEPCHVLVQFYVTPADEHDLDKRFLLSSQLYQRSIDTSLGCPFNIVSYSLLTIMIAKILNMRPKEFILVGGDCHIYVNHIESLYTQLNNPIGQDATVDDIKIQPDGTDLEKLLAIKIDDIEISYSQGPLIKMQMAI